MQLESTLFGVCVIQIKPQLEKLLKLPPDSLTKEIKLTQELLSLFIQYQIPSDLLSYEGPAEVAPADKLAKVKDYVARMYEMIDIAQKKEIEEAQKREAFRLAELNRTPIAPPAPGGRGMPPPMPPMAAPMPVMRSAMAGGPPPPPPQMAEPIAMESSSAIAFDAASAQMPEAPRETASQKTTQTSAATPAESADPEDYTRIPIDLDKKLDALDTDGALRPAIIHPGKSGRNDRTRVFSRTPSRRACSSKIKRTRGTKPSISSMRSLARARFRSTMQRCTS
jgi:hypothetical protein